MPLNIIGEIFLQHADLSRRAFCIHNVNQLYNFRDLISSILNILGSKLIQYNNKKCHRWTQIQSTGAIGRLRRTEVIFPEKLKCQTFEWKTGLADIMSTNRHHLWKEENFKCAEWEESKKFEHHFVQFIPSTKM